MLCIFLHPKKVTGREVKVSNSQMLKLTSPWNDFANTSGDASHNSGRLTSVKANASTINSKNREAEALENEIPTLGVKDERVA